MNRTRLIFGLTAMLTIFAITTATASAKFVGVGGATSGASQLKTNTGAVFTVNGTSAPLVSSKAPDTWRIQDTKSEQRVTKEGDHLDVTSTFEEVHAIPPTGAPVPATINNPIELQIVQKGTTFTARVSKEAIIKVPVSETAACTVKIGVKGNEELSTVTAKTVETKNTEVNANVTGITTTDEPTAACEPAGITPGKVGTFKAITIEHGVTVV
jgi:hypothetical protein